MAVLLMVNGGVTPFNFTPTISADTLNYNLRAAAVAAGWNQTDPLNATVTINSGVYVGSSNTSGYGFDTGVTFPRWLYSGAREQRLHCGRWRCGRLRP